MNRLTAILVCVAVCVAFPLTPQRGEAQVANILATKLFETGVGNERNGLAFDPSTELLYVADGLAQLRAYTLDGTQVQGPDPLPGDGRAGELGLQIVREATSIGGVAVPAGTLTFIQAGRPEPPSANETTLYALDKTTGLQTATQVLITGLQTPPPADCVILKDRAKGLGFSTHSNLFVSFDITCSVVAEIDNGVVAGFFKIPPIAGSSGGGGLKVHPLTGNVWVGGAFVGGANNLAEFSQEGALLRQYLVLDANTGVPVSIRRLAFDATGQRLFLLQFLPAAVYLVAGPPVEAIPGLGPWGYLALLFGLGTIAPILGRRGRAGRAS